MNLHAVRHPRLAGRDQLFLSLNLHTADTAGANLINILQITQMGDGNVQLFRRFHDRIMLRNRSLLAVDRHLYHSITLPFLKLPKPN